MEIRLEELKNPDTDVEDGNKRIIIDTVHQDEALKVLVAYEGEQAWTNKEENQVRRIIDFTLMPVLCITYGLQYYDKAMLSQAVSSCLCQSSCTKTNYSAGSFRATNRSGTDEREPLLLLRGHFLSGLYRWCIPSHDSCAKVPNRTRSLRNRHSLGSVSHSDNGLSQLPSTLCSKVLPRLPRKRDQSYVYDDCRAYSTKSFSGRKFSKKAHRGVSTRRTSRLFEWESGTRVRDTSPSLAHS